MYTRQELVDYVEALDKLTAAEAKLIEGGLLLEDEAISIHQRRFFDQRIARLNNLIVKGRYEE